MSVGDGLLVTVLWASLMIPVPIPAQARADSGRGVAAKASAPPGGMVKPKLPPTIKVPTTHAALFSERDARAESAIGYFACLQETVNALRTGALGAVPREWSIACMKEGAEWRGLFGELTDAGAGFVVRRQYAVRRRAVVTDVVDTVRAGSVARALLRGLSAPLPGAGQFEVVPVVLPQATFAEVWFLPVPSSVRTTVGGDSLIQMSRDGTRELGHSRTAPPPHDIVMSSQGSSLMIVSAEERIPLLSELLVAHGALSRGPLSGTSSPRPGQPAVSSIVVRTRQYESVLTRTVGNAGVWRHTRR